MNIHDKSPTVGDDEAFDEDEIGDMFCEAMKCLDCFGTGSDGEPNGYGCGGREKWIKKVSALSHRPAPAPDQMREALMAICDDYHNHLVYLETQYPKVAEDRAIMSPGKLNGIVAEALQSAEPVSQGGKWRREDMPPMTEQEQFDARMYLALNHGCSGIYGDDGEIQCNMMDRHGLLDFKRQTYSELAEALMLMRYKELSESQPAETPTCETPGPDTPDDCPVWRLEKIQMIIIAPDQVPQYQWILKKYGECKSSDTVVLAEKGQGPPPDGWKPGGKG